VSIRKPGNIPRRGVLAGQSDETLDTELNLNKVLLLDFFLKCSERGFMLKGRVKWYDSDKGYGMIQGVDDGRTVFVHFSDVDGGKRDLLRIEDEVEFELLETPQGPRAINVRKILPENQAGS